MNINIPISLDWTTDEVIDVVQFFEAVEKVYETGIDKESFLELYKRFKKIVPSKSEEKQLFKQFDDESSYSCYKAVKTAQESTTKKIKLS